MRRAKVISCPVGIREIGFGVPLSNRTFIGECGRFREALAREVQNGSHFLRCRVENLRDLIQRQTSFEIFEHGLNWHPSSAEHPCSAHLAGNTFHCRALGPIERRHTLILISIEAFPVREESHSPQDALGHYPVFRVEIFPQLFASRN